VERTVWRNERGKAHLESWYERFRERIGAPVESRILPTSLGPSHVLVAGDREKPALVCLHSMRTGSAHFLSELRPLLPDFHLIAPDLPGQSVRGPQRRVSLQDGSHTRWLGEILDEMRISQPNLFGVSWGGFVALQAASRDPGRYRRLVLLVPAGIVNGSHLQGLARMALPMLRYRIRPTERNLRRFLDPILTHWDPEWAAYMGETLRSMAIEPRIPPLATDDQLRRLSLPMLLLGAERDISFPGRPMVERVRALVPGVDAEVIPDAKHCPPTTEEFRAWLAGRVATFLG
jgi:2-hydroxy-6-oxonona-2,4-dienedioate hydrolase